jgi:hypothetical protein
MVNPVGDVTGAACGLFRVIVELSYPVVAEIFVSAKFVFAVLRLVRNSDQTPCFCTVWKDPLNDGNEDVVLIICTTRNTSAAASALRGGFFVVGHDAQHRE